MVLFGVNSGYVFEPLYEFGQYFTIVIDSIANFKKTYARDFDG
jgi:hypothetical protein